MIRTSLLALALVMGAGQAFAAVNADGTEVDTVKPVCEFVAEAGGYRCVMPAQHASLSEPNEGNGKKKLFIQQVNPNLNFPKFP